MTELVPMTRDEARLATEHIRNALTTVSDAWAMLAERVAEAYRRRADLALGYDSWAAYAAAELQPEDSLSVEIRRQLVGMLSAQGMSTRAIAPAVGVTHSAVVKDRARLSGGSAGTTSPEAPTLTDARAEPNVIRTNEFSDGSTQQARRADWPERKDSPAPAAVKGLDGKTYARPEPATARPEPQQPEQQAPRRHRRPLPDAFWETRFDLGKKAESLHRLVLDDRWPTNRKKVAEANLNDLLRCRDLLQQVIDQLSLTTKDI